MGDAKRIVVRPIDRQSAEECIRRWHYSGKTVNNSQLHLGAFFNDQLLGAMQFGPSLDKRKIQGLVENTGWNEFVELNRMAFSDALPRNSESRCLSIAMLLLRKHAPQVKWVVSFSDATQCGDGTIYRASGFLLTGITTSKNLVKRADGVVIHKMTLESNPTKPRQELGGKSYFDITGGRYDLLAYAKATGGITLPGFQLRYVYFIDETARSRLTVPVLPFSELDRVGARMYRGKRAGTSTRNGAPAAVGGATPTPALHRART